MVQLLWKIGGFLQKLNIFLPYIPAILLLHIYPKEFKSYVYTKASMCLFIAVLCIIANTWKQLKCLSVGNWIDNL